MLLAVLWLVLGWLVPSGLQIAPMMQRRVAFMLLGTGALLMWRRARYSTPVFEAPRREPTFALAAPEDAEPASAGSDAQRLSP
jgi:hypothetical protein